MPFAVEFKVYFAIKINTSWRFVKRKVATGGTKCFGIAIDARVFQSTNGMLDDFELLRIFNIYVKVKLTSRTKCYLTVCALIQLYITRKAFGMGEVIGHVMSAVVLELVL